MSNLTFHEALRMMLDGKTVLRTVGTKTYQVRYSTTIEAFEIREHNKETRWGKSGICNDKEDQWTSYQPTISLEEALLRLSQGKVVVALEGETSKTYYYYQLYQGELYGSRGRTSPLNAVKIQAFCAGPHTVFLDE